MAQMTKERAKEILDAACLLNECKNAFNKKYPESQIWMPDIQFGSNDDVVEDIANALQLTRKYTPISFGFLVAFSYNGVEFYGGVEK